jgi:hypothetical protein
MEIDARGETFQEFEDFGNQLIQNQHYESESIREKLEEMQRVRDGLGKSAHTFRKQNQHILQNFIRF